MHLRSCLVGSALALGANALLVIPEVEDAIAPEADFPPAHPLEAYAPQQQQVELACTECPFPEVSDDGKVTWTDGFQTSLSLNFAIENGFLLANGRQIFPPPPPTLITAVQRRVSDGVETEPIPLGYAVEEMPLPTPPEDPMELVAVRFTVLDLDSRPVPLDTVALTLIHDPNSGELYMAKTEIEETTPDRVSWTQCRGKPKCLRRLLFDRMRSLFAAAKARMLGMGPKSKHCGGPHGSDHPRPPRPHHHHDEFDPDRMPLPPMDEEVTGFMEKFGRPHHHHGEFDPERMPPPPMDGEEAGFMEKFGRPHHHHHHHGFPPMDGEEHGFKFGHPHHHMHPHMHHGQWERTVHRVVRFIVVPAVLGVLAGLAASALGMLVGQIVVFMWQRFRRSTPKKSLEQGTVSEKQGLMTESSEELPPAYSDEEAEVEEVVVVKN